MEQGIFAGREAFVAAVRQGLELALEREARELFWLDADFVHWPLSDVEVLDLLTRWARPHRRLHLLAPQFDSLRQRHPRFVQWRRNWDHLIKAGAFDADLLSGADLQALMLAPGAACVRLFDADHWRGALSAPTEGVRGDELLSRQWFDAIEQRSSESFGASTLGL
ncbi:hypothetical protein [Pelomonas sp. SE-A7]|uniref:hypothetical protein n=1 Tax=Pelomonas sp. SE-A7 TaxID=3054953 RepID=UPI00259CD247|nr:hypothetical protein [Pelomonas sp. SE-A7]MDM4765510.1 hypothetical protein [Pelomonas sp. SE-A7]